LTIQYHLVMVITLHLELSQMQLTARIGLFHSWRTAGYTTGVWR